MTSRVAISLVKNEIEILPDFAGHVLAMFDRWICIDHNSTDGTHEYITSLAQQDSNVNCLRYVSKGYFQSEIMTYIARYHRWCRDADWVFMLDADEFLPFSNKDAFDEALSEFKNNGVIRMQWMNLVPENYIDGKVQGKKYYFPKNSASHSKVAFQPRLVPLREFKVAQGNHNIEIGIRSTPLLAKQAFPMYHVPLRSFEQLREKLSVGLAAYKASGQQNSELGIHWKNIGDFIAKSGLDQSIANYVAASYGESDFSKNVHLTKDNLRLQSIELRELESEIVTPDMQQPTGVTIKLPQIELRVDKNRSPAILGDDIETYFDFTDDAESERGMPSYQTLDELVDDESIHESTNIDLLEFIQPSYLSIDHLTPSAWGGHIPFMFSVVAAQRPRRFVELGSHHGASFFAGCQSMNYHGVPGEAIAIDTWSGDHQAGYYDETVYNNFSWILKQNYKDFGRALRLDFDTAVDQFEENSIDLLHIDGLHTYDAVKHDFETWRPKLSANATVLFHDTNVHRDDFGVYKYWSEIRDLTHSFNFLHTHGLGVLAFGGTRKNPVARLLAHVEKLGLSEFLEAHYSRLGALVCSEAMSQIKKLEEEREYAAKISRDQRKLVTRIKKALSVRKAKK